MTYGIKADGSECRHHPQYCDCYVDDLRAAIRGLLATGLTEAQYEGTDVGNINRARKSWLAAVTEARRALTPKRSPHPVTLEEAEAEYHAEGEK